MGNSTIIELDHDKWEEIFNNEEGHLDFLNQIQEQIANFKHNGKSINGGEVVIGCHRDDKIYKEWIKFKKKITGGK